MELQVHTVVAFFTIYIDVIMIQEQRSMKSTEVHNPCASAVRKIACKVSALLLHAHMLVTRMLIVGGVWVHAISGAWLVVSMLMISVHCLYTII